MTETVAQLTDIFGELSSLFNTRCNCLKLKKDDNEDFFAYAGKVNLQCENFQLKSLTEDQFKCLIFIAGLQSPNDADIRPRLLSMPEQDRDLAVQTLTTECQRLLKLKRDTERKQQEPFKSSVSSRVISMEKSLTKRKKPPTPCWSCGDWHYARFCPFKKHTCQLCSRRGHKDGFCERRDKDNTTITNMAPSRGKTHNKKTGHFRKSTSNSIFATFNVNFEACWKYIVVLINKNW